MCVSVCVWVCVCVCALLFRARSALDIPRLMLDVGMGCGARSIGDEVVDGIGAISNLAVRVVHLWLLSECFLKL